MGATPPLPDMIDVLDQSKRIDDYPGLRDWSRRWLAWGPAARARVADEALRLARPSFRPASLAAVGRTAASAARATAPGIAADARKRAREGQLEKGAAIKHVQELVKAGGSTYVKLGQFVATAQGLLPNEWVEAFGWCRDTVTPMGLGMAEQLFEDSLEVPLDRVLMDFDPVPIGAASIGQVHSAKLPDGTDVVVKVRRPGLREQFESDLRAMALAAAAAERASKAARTANLSGFVELFAQLVLEEIDFRFEALNQIEIMLASEAAGHDFATYPRPIPHLVAEDVLVMTRVPGVRYTDALEHYPDAVDGERLLRLAVTGVLEHMMAYGIFHGDLHAGNVLVNEEGDFSLIDFGIAGRIDAAQRAAVVKFLVGFGRNDTRLQLVGLQGFGAVPMDADIDGLAREITDQLNALDPSLLARDKPMTVDQLGQALAAIIRTLAASGFRLPKELVLFFKNLLYLNGFAAALAPDTNLFDQIEPVFTYFMTRYPQELAVIIADVDQ
jgi:ubiquinone biosynthesis protein